MKDPITLKGKVVHGKALGRTVGMPTANLCVEQGILPENGVYATRIRIGDELFQSITNIGNRPTVDREQDITIETYIFDFNKDIYGQMVELEVYKFLRPIQKFESLEQVQIQVKKDVMEAKKYLDMLETK